LLSISCRGGVVQVIAPKLHSDPQRMASAPVLAAQEAEAEKGAPVRQLVRWRDEATKLAAR
jgi:hypothetical protein